MYPAIRPARSLWTARRPSGFCGAAGGRVVNGVTSLPGAADVSPRGPCQSRRVDGTLRAQQEHTLYMMRERW